MSKDFKLDPLIADELKHYGVKGMKWGVRKKDDGSEGGTTSSSPRETPKLNRGKQPLTDAQMKARRRKILIATGVTMIVGAAAVGTVVGVDLNRKINIETNAIVTRGKDYTDYLMSIGDKGMDTVLPKGTDFHRVASKLEKGIDSAKYATYRETDVLKFRENWVNVVGKESFATKFEAMDTVRIASGKRQVELLGELMDRPMGDYKGSTMRQELIDDARGFVKKQAIKRASGESLAAAFGSHERISSGAEWLNENQTAKSKMLVSELIKRGYAGVTDTNYGSRYDSEAGIDHSVVLLNDAVFKTTGAVLTKAERQAAGDRLRELGVASMYRQRPINTSRRSNV